MSLQFKVFSFDSRHELSVLSLCFLIALCFGECLKVVILRLVDMMYHFVL
jgi:hypothetical protein